MSAPPRVEEALSLFPEIAEKHSDRGGALSGGEQQMLAVAQGLVRRPKLLMLDEPSAGLSPVLVDRVLDVVARLRRADAAVLLDWTGTRSKRRSRPRTGSTRSRRAGSS